MHGQVSRQRSAVSGHRSIPSIFQAIFHLPENNVLAVRAPGFAVAMRQQREVYTIVTYTQCALMRCGITIYSGDVLHFAASPLADIISNNRIRNVFGRRAAISGCKMLTYRYRQGRQNIKLPMLCYNDTSPVQSTISYPPHSYYIIVIEDFTYVKIMSTNVDQNATSRVTGSCIVLSVIEDSFNTPIGAYSAKI